MDEKETLYEKGKINQKNFIGLYLSCGLVGEIGFNAI